MNSGMSSDPPIAVCNLSLQLSHLAWFCRAHSFASSLAWLYCEIARVTGSRRIAKNLGVAGGGYVLRILLVISGCQKYSGVLSRYTSLWSGGERSL